MNKPKNRTIWVLLILTIMLLVGGGISFQREIREQYWVWKYKNCESDCNEILIILGHLKSSKAIPIVLDKASDMIPDSNGWFVAKVISEKEFNIFKKFKNPRDAIELMPDALISDEIDFLRIMKANNPDEMNNFLLPYLKNPSVIIRATVACVLFDSGKEIQKHIPSKNYWGSGL